MGDRGDTWIAGVVVAFGAIVTAVWAGAHLAALLSRAPFHRPWPDGVAAIIGLADDPANPATAWGYPPEKFPSPALYWASTVFTAVVVLTVTVWGWTAWTQADVGIHRSERLGVIPEARMATRKEMKPLRVKQPVPGRFGFGRVMGQIVATEDPATQSRRQIRDRARSRVGDRTSLLIFGTTRSGKTATVVPGVLEWDHPAIISSVKADLMMATVQRRKAIGEVFVFDPFGVAPKVDGVVPVSWSPIACADTVSGALAAAKTLADASRADDVTTAGFWAERGAALLWPLLFAASLGTRSMADVRRWLSLQDGVDEQPSEIRTILTDAVKQQGVVGLQAQIALDEFEGWCALDDRPRSDQSSSAQSMVSCWADPYASAASDPRLEPIDIGRILSGRNTLYIVQPLGRGDHFSALFGGLFGDLVRDQAYRVAQAAGTRIGPLLALLDEAANTPLRWLPEVASTCAGIGIQLVTVWQDRSQIDALYGDLAQSVLNNHATKVFFAGQTDPATLELASMLCGEEDVTSTGASADLQLGSSRRSVSVSPTTKRLVPPDLLRQIPNGTALLIHNTLRPAHMAGRRIDEEPQLAASARGEGPKPPALTSDPAVVAAFPSARASVPAHVLEHLGGRSE